MFLSLCTTQAEGIDCIIKIMSKGLAEVALLILILVDINISLIVNTINPTLGILITYQGYERGYGIYKYRQTDNVCDSTRN